MLLLNIKSNKKDTFIEVQNGEKAYRSRGLTETECTFYTKEVVLSMLTSVNYNNPLLNVAIPEAVEQKKSLKDGIGLSDDHKQLLLVKDGKVEVIDSGARWMIADSLKVRVAHAIKNSNHIKGQW